MTDDERADRRNRIREASTASNNRVQDFINLVAQMCAERTRSRRARGNLVEFGHDANPFDGRACLGSKSRAALRVFDSEDGSKGSAEGRADSRVLLAG